MDGKRNGVGVILKEELVRNVLEVKGVMTMKLEIEGVMFSVATGYTPQAGCEFEEKDKFCREVDEVMQSILRDEREAIGEDSTGHGVEGNRDDEGCDGQVWYHK